MRAWVIGFVCLAGCSSSTYLEPLGEPAPDAVAETSADVAAPALDAPAADVARVEPAREASVQVEAAAPDAGAPEADVEAAVQDAATDVPEAIEAAADVTVDAALEVAVDVKPPLAVAGEWCGPERACAAEGLPWSANGTTCLTDIAPVAYNIGDAPILTYCAKRCLVENSECIGWGGGCCATVRFADGTEGNACVSPENCKW